MDAIIGFAIFTAIGFGILWLLDYGHKPNPDL